MYNLPYFKVAGHEQVVQFMQQHSFITLLGCLEGRAVATQVPVLFRFEGETIFLRGHVFRNSDHQRAFTSNNEVLCLFAGPHAYVSASWYNHPAQASTWNYMTVQARGLLQFLSEPELLKILEETTSLFEKGPASPAAFKNLSPEYVSKLAKAIVGFEIEITDLQHVFKLSQNRDAESFQNIIQQLQQGDAAAQEIATAMIKLQPQLFETT